MQDLSSCCSASSEFGTTGVFNLWRNSCYPGLPNMLATLCVQDLHTCDSQILHEALIKVLKGVVDRRQPLSKTGLNVLYAVQQRLVSVDSTLTLEETMDLITRQLELLATLWTANLTPKVRREEFCRLLSQILVKLRDVAVNKTPEASVHPFAEVEEYLSKALKSLKGHTITEELQQELERGCITVYPISCPLVSKRNGTGSASFVYSGLYWQY